MSAADQARDAERAAQGRVNGIAMAMAAMWTRGEIVGADTKEELSRALAELVLAWEALAQELP